MREITVRAQMGGESARAMLIHCFDPRFRQPFTEFAREVGDGKEVASISLPGGCWWLGNMGFLTEGRVRRLVLGDMKRFRTSVRDFVLKRGLGEAILVNHQDCRWYRDRNPGLSAGELIKIQGRDLVRAADEIRDWLGIQFPVSGYLATFDNERRVAFSQII